MVGEAERDENTERKGYAPTEALALAQSLEEMERREAKKRQGGPGRDRSGKLPEHTAEARDKIAAGVGMSATSLRKVAEVVEAAKAEPGRFAEIRARMDATGKVNTAYKAVQAAKQARPLEPAADVGSGRAILT